MVIQQTYTTHFTIAGRVPVRTDEGIVEPEGVAVAVANLMSALAEKDGLECERYEGGIPSPFDTGYYGLRWDLIDRTRLLKDGYERMPSLGVQSKVMPEEEIDGLCGVENTVSIKNGSLTWEQFAKELYRMIGFENQE